MNSLTQIVTKYLRNHCRTMLLCRYQDKLVYIYGKFNSMAKEIKNWLNINEDNECADGVFGWVGESHACIIDLCHAA